MSVQSSLLRTSCLALAASMLCLSVSVHAIPTSPCPFNEDAGLDAFSGQQHSLTLDEDGWLLLEVESLSEAPSWFEVLDSPCAQDANPTVIDHGLDHGLVWLRAGEVGLRFGTVAADEGDTVHLVTHFVADQLRWKDGDLRYPADKDGDDPDTETGGGEIVPVQDPLMADPWSGCAVGSEPFNDFGLCATHLALHRPQLEVLGEARRADRDYFTFTVQDSGPMEVVVHSEVPLNASLMLDNGRVLRHTRLDAADGDGTTLSVEAFLLPGTYWVRVESLDGTAGAYEIELRTGVTGS